MAAYKTYERAHKLFCGHLSGVHSLAGSNTRTTFFSGSNDHSIRSWDLEHTLCNTVFLGHDACVSSLKTLVYNNELLLSGGVDHRILIWDAFRSNQCVTTIEAHFGQVYELCLDPKEPHLFYSCSDSSVKCWDLRTWKPLKEFRSISGPIFSIRVAPLSIRKQKELSLFDSDFDSNVVQGDIEERNRLVLIAGSKSGAITCLDFENEEILLHYPSVHYGNVVTLDYDEQTGYLVSGSEDSTVLMWQANTGQLIRKVTNHGDQVTCVLVNDRNLYSSSLDGCVKEFELHSGLLKRVFQRPAVHILCCEKTKENLLYLGTDEEVIRSFDLNTH